MSENEIAEWKKHLSESHKGERNKFFGKHHTEETKNKKGEITPYYLLSMSDLTASKPYFEVGI